MANSQIVNNAIFTFVKCGPKETKGDEFPRPRSGHRVVCDQKYLYSYGGFNPKLDDSDIGADDEWHISKPVFRELWRYNICSQRWKKLQCLNIPKVLASNSVLLCGKLILVFGGTGAPFGELCSKSLYICDLSKKDLSFEKVKTSGESPEPIYGQGMVLDKKYLYIIGGTSGYHFNMDIHRLDLVTKVWKKVIPVNPHECPDARYRHELAFYKGEIYVFGGGTNIRVFPFTNIPVFNLKTRAWRNITTHTNDSIPYPEARKSHSLVQVPGQEHLVIICGGYNDLIPFNDTWMFDIVTRTWYNISSLYLPRCLHFHDSAVTPSGKMITFGGINPSGENEQVRTNDVLVTWVCVPTLSELSLQVLLLSHPNITSLSIDDLYKLGIPNNFVMRIVDDEVIKSNLCHSNSSQNSMDYSSSD